jgi:hypothetical protein
MWHVISYVGEEDMSQHHNHIIIMQLQKVYHTMHEYVKQSTYRDSQIENIANKSRVYLSLSIQPLYHIL